MKYITDDLTVPWLLNGGTNFRAWQDELITSSQGETWFKRHKGDWNRILSPTPFTQSMMALCHEARDVHYERSGYNKLMLDRSRKTKGLVKPPHYGDQWIDCSGLVTYILRDILKFTKGNNGNGYPHHNCVMLWDTANKLNALISYDEARVKPGACILMITGTDAGIDNRPDIYYNNPYGHISLVVAPNVVIQTSLNYQAGLPGEKNASGQNTSTIQLTGPDYVGPWYYTGKKFPRSKYPLMVGVDMHKILTILGVHSDFVDEKEGTDSEPKPKRTANKSGDIDLSPNASKTEVRIANENENPPVEITQGSECDDEYLKTIEGESRECSINYLEDDAHVVTFQQHGENGLGPLDLEPILQYFTYIRNLYVAKKHRLIAGKRRNYMANKRIDRKSLATILRNDLIYYLHWLLVQYNTFSADTRKRYSIAGFFFVEDDFKRSPMPDGYFSEHSKLIVSLLRACGMCSEDDTDSLISKKSLIDATFDRIWLGQHTLLGVEQLDCYQMDVNVSYLTTELAVPNTVALMVADNRRIVIKDNQILRNPVASSFSGSKQITGLRTNTTLGRSHYTTVTKISTQTGVSRTDSLFRLLISGLRYKNWDGNDAWDPDISQSIRRIVSNDLGETLLDFVRTRMPDLGSLNLDKLVFLPRYKEACLPEDNSCTLRPNLLLTVMGYGINRGSEIFVKDMLFVRDGKYGMTAKMLEDTEMQKYYRAQFDDADGSFSTMNYF